MGKSEIFFHRYNFNQIVFRNQSCKFDIFIRKRSNLYKTSLKSLNDLPIVHKKNLYFVQFYDNILRMRTRCARDFLYIKPAKFEFD